MTRKIKMFKYVFIIPEAELKRRWFNFQVIITRSINSESYHNLVTKAKFYHISAHVWAGDFGLTKE